MRKVKSLQDIENIVDNKWDLFKIANGKQEEISLIKILQMTILDTLAIIAEGQLHYQTD